MTTRLTVLASGFLFAVAATASAQQVIPVPSVPHALPVPPVPEVRVDGPDVYVDFQTPFHSEWSLTEQEAFKIAGVQKDKEIKITVPQPFNFKFQELNQLESLYSQARQRIDSNQYDRALEPLERLIDAKGSRADAAMYWKAYSLMKLARRDEALSTLGQMTKQFPDSRWLRDARALEVEVKQASGQNVSADLVDDDTKLLALQGIMRTDPDAALPAVEKMLAGSGSVKLKDRALFVLSQSRSDRALPILGNVARTNTNPDLQQRAIRYLGISNSPEAITTLTAVYRGDNSVETRKAVISALSSSRNQAATPALVSLAKAERNPELKTQIVRYLSNSSSAEAKAYMLEILSK